MEEPGSELRSLVFIPRMQRYSLGSLAFCVHIKWRLTGGSWDFVLQHIQSTLNVHTGCSIKTECLNSVFFPSFLFCLFLLLPRSSILGFAVGQNAGSRAQEGTSEPGEQTQNRGRKRLKKRMSVRKEVLEQIGGRNIFVEQPP